MRIEKQKVPDEIASKDDFMKLEDGEYIEDEQEMSLNEFYAAT